MQKIQKTFKCKLSMLIIIILILLLYIAFGCFYVTLLDKFEEFKCKDTDERLMQGVFWPFMFIFFLFYNWGKFCTKISKKILKQ